MIRNQQARGSNPRAGSNDNKGLPKKADPFLFQATIWATIQASVATKIFYQVGATIRATNHDLVAPRVIPSIASVHIAALALHRAPGLPPVALASPLTSKKKENPGTGTPAPPIKRFPTDEIQKSFGNNLFTKLYPGG